MIEGQRRIQKGGGQESVPHRNLLRGGRSPPRTQNLHFQILNSRVKDKRRLKKQKIGVCIFRCPNMRPLMLFHNLVTANINIQMLILININA